jgi:hypothetical protein
MSTRADCFKTCSFIAGALAIGLAGISARGDDSRIIPQATAEAPMDLSVVGQALGEARRRTFEHAMELKKTDKEVFWAIYGDFEKEKNGLDDRAMKVLSGYLANHAALTNEQSLRLISEWDELQQQQMALRMKYFNILSEKLSGVTAARFYQVDEYVTAAAKVDLLDNLPFIGEKERP